MAPKIIVHTKYDDGDAFIYSFCNGGDLKAFLAKCQDKEQRIPEVLFWHVIQRVCEMLALAHSGWIVDGVMPDNWAPIIHTDVHEGNIFLHWPDEKALLPHIMLGDWSMASYVEDYKTTRKTEWREMEREELTVFHEALKSLHTYRSNDYDEATCGGNCPLRQFERLWSEAVDIAELAETVHGFSIARYIAERMNVLANIKIQILQLQNPQDFRWTKPGPIEGFLTFGGDESPNAAMRTWISETKRRWEREITKPWYMYFY